MDNWVILRLKFLESLFEALFGPLMGMPGDGFLNGLGRQSRILGKALNVSRLEQGITHTGNAGGDHLQSLASEDGVLTGFFQQKILLKK